MRRALAIACVLMGLAACEESAESFENPYLFEPYLFNDIAYNVSFISATPAENGAAELRAIKVFRMTDAPFGPDDVAEATAVARDFCASATREFRDDPVPTLGLDGGFVFDGNCLARAG